MSVRTNNGVEQKIKDFKHQYRVKFKDKSLSVMITILVEHFLPDKEKCLVGSSYLFLTSFIITHHYWPTTKQWHSKLIFHIYIDRIAFICDQFSWFPRIWKNA